MPNVGDMVIYHSGMTYGDAPAVVLEVQETTITVLEFNTYYGINFQFEISEGTEAGQYSVRS